MINANIELTINNACPEIHEIEEFNNFSFFLVSFKFPSYLYKNFKIPSS